MAAASSRARNDFSDLDPHATALLVVDMSRDFIAPGAPMECREGREMAPRLARLLARCREVGLTVVYVNHVHRPGARDMGTLAERFPRIASGAALRADTPGVEMWEELTPQPGDLVIEKIRQSGFAYTSLEAVLGELGVRTVVMAGVSVSACVECTARDAVARDFDVIMLADGTATSSLPDLGWGAVDSTMLQRVFLTNFAYHFGRVATIQQLLDGPLAVVASPEAATTARAGRDSLAPWPSARGRAAPCAATPSSVYSPVLRAARRARMVDDVRADVVERWRPLHLVGRPVTQEANMAKQSFCRPATALARSSAGLSRRRLLTGALAGVAMPVVGVGGRAGRASERYDLSRGMYAIITGSGSALVDPQRGNASQAVVVDGTVIQFDCGRRTMDNLVRAGVNPIDVDYMFFTHLHFDHIVEYGYYVISSWIAGRDEPFKVFGPEGTVRMSEAAIYGVHATNIDFVKGIVWPDSPRGGPRQTPPVTVADIGAGLIVDTAAFTIRATETPHFSAAYQKKGMKSLGYRVDCRHGSVAISGDTAPSQDMIDLARDADLLIHECVMPDVGMTSGGKFNRVIDERTAGKSPTGHTRPSELGELATKARVKKVVATHLGPFTSDQAAVDMSKIYTGPKREGPEFWTKFVSAITKAYDGPVILAEDAMVIPIGRSS